MQPKSKKLQILEKMIRQIIKEETEEKFDKDSVEELLDAMGQERYKWINQFEGISSGDFGKVKFKIMPGSSEFRLIFEDGETAKRAFNSLSNQLTNPYSFASRFDMMPTVVMVQWYND